MKQSTRILSLLMALVTILTLTACNSKPDVSLDESIKGGLSLLDTSKDSNREFTLQIQQGDGYEYCIDGTITKDVMLASVTVLHNGLKSNYKNIIATKGNDLYVNLNSTMSAVEDETDFLFTESLPFHGKHLLIPNGKTALTEWFNEMYKTNVHVWSEVRKNQESCKGDYDYNFEYSHDTSIKLPTEMSAKLSASSNSSATILDKHMNDITKNTSEDYNKILSYLNDCIDIDTEEVLKEHETLGARYERLWGQELNALINLLQQNGAYITEGLSYSSKDESYEHKITFYGKDEKIFGSLHLTINTVDKVNPVSPDTFQIISVEDFMPVFLSNVKHAKGVGYETNDFPYDVTYTSNQLVAVETNGLYKATHTFTFNYDNLTDYSVAYETYEVYIHDALMRDAEGTALRLMSESSDALRNGTGGGQLTYSTTTIPGEYSCSSPVELLNLLKELGVPSYD
jgi:hypothetical protein